MPWALHGLSAQNCARALGLDGLTGVQHCAPGGSSVREGALEGGRIVSLCHRCLLFLERIVLHRTGQHRLSQNNRQEWRPRPLPVSACAGVALPAAGPPLHACQLNMRGLHGLRRHAGWVRVCLCGDLRLSLK